MHYTKTSFDMMSSLNTTPNFQVKCVLCCCMLTKVPQTHLKERINLMHAYALWFGITVHLFLPPFDFWHMKFVQKTCQPLCETAPFIFK